MHPCAQMLSYTQVVERYYSFSEEIKSISCFIRNTIDWMGKAARASGCVKTLGHEWLWYELTSQGWEYRKQGKRFADGIWLLLQSRGERRVQRSHLT